MALHTARPSTESSSSQVSVAQRLRVCASARLRVCVPARLRVVAPSARARQRCRRERTPCSSSCCSASTQKSSSASWVRDEARPFM